MKLSILIPSVPSRFFQSTELFLRLQKMAEGKPVEVLMLTDNKQRSVGMKRQALLEAARGDYVAFVDDDDGIEPCYIDALLEGIVRDPDVVTFKQQATVNGEVGFVDFSVMHKRDEPWRPGETVKRRPWHPCAWKREIALKGVFTDKMFGEDVDWLNQVIRYARTESHIPRVLHHYRYNENTSEAPPDV